MTEISDLHLEIYNRHAAGQTPYKICRDLKVSQNTVRIVSDRVRRKIAKAMREYGPQKPRPPCPPPPTLEELAHRGMLKRKQARQPYEASIPKDEAVTVQVTKGYFPLNGDGKAFVGDVIKVTKAEAEHMAFIGCGHEIMVS
jgi:hypothetical protein